MGVVSLNGSESELKGGVLEVEGKVAKVTGKGTKGTKGKAGKGDDKMKEKLAAFSASQKVWIGGLTEG